MDSKTHAELVRAFRLELKRDRRRNRLEDAPYNGEPVRFAGRQPKPPARMTEAEARAFWARTMMRVPHDAPARPSVINHGLTPAQIRARSRRMARASRNATTDSAIAGRRARIAANRLQQRRR